MQARGKLIALEGIDGAGKRTQVEWLGRALDRRGIAHADFSFPRYHSFFGQSVARYLRGEFGPLDRVNPRLSALLYAGDRLEAKMEMEVALRSCPLVVVDRYIGSNLAHQGARTEPGEREEFLTWVRQLEYEILGLPREDLTFYLRLPVAESARRLAERAARLTRDLHESDARHLEAAAAIYEELARGPGWAVIESLDPATNQPRPPEAVHQEIVELLETRLGLGRS